MTMRHCPQDALGSPSGGLWCDLADVRDGEASDRRAAPGARPVNHDVGHRPVGRTRTPKPGSLESQTANSFACGFRPSTTRLVIRPSAMAAPSLGPKILRGNTGETPERKPRETRGSRICLEMPITRGFLMLGEL